MTGLLFLYPLLDYNMPIYGENTPVCTNSYLFGGKIEEEFILSPCLLIFFFNYTLNVILLDYLVIISKDNILIFRENGISRDHLFNLFDYI